MSLEERWRACSEKHGWAALAARGQLGPWDAATRTPEPLECDEDAPRRVLQDWRGDGRHETVVISSSSESEGEGEETRRARNRFVVISSDEDEDEAHRGAVPDVSPVRPRGSAAGVLSTGQQGHAGTQLTQALEAITLDDDEEEEEGLARAWKNEASRVGPQGPAQGTTERTRPHLQRLSSASSSSSSSSSSSLSGLSLSSSDSSEDEDDNARYHDDSFVVDDDYCSFEEENEDSFRR